MLESIKKLALIYILFVAIFVIQKPIFILFHNDLYHNITFLDLFYIIYNGLPLDLLTSAYLSIVPGVILIASFWVKRNTIIKRLFYTYFFTVSLIIATALCLDIALYEYWGFRLDMSPIFYISTSPSAALASAPIYYYIIGIIFSISIAFGLTYIFQLFTTKHKNERVTANIKAKICCSTILLLPIEALFIPTHKSIKINDSNISPLNSGSVYFSPRQELNHAAINPLFSFAHSALHQNKFSSQFQYFSSEDADQIYSSFDKHSSIDSTIYILNKKRPDIYLIILESFSQHLLNARNDNQPIVPHLNILASQGIFFSNFYASGRRTERCIPAILSAYPAQPTTSIMKYANKTDNLPSLAKSLKKAGWETSYYYGGDANFINIHAYLISSGFETIISDKDFPDSEHYSKWGVHDHVVFNKCVNDIVKNGKNKPQFRVIQTSSSHEPFEVPYRRLSNNIANAFAYTDSCLGDFISKLKQHGKWEQSLVIITPDHFDAYPIDITKFIDKHHIPLVFTGGAIKQPMNITNIGSQTDIAATLLHQLDIPHNEFIFSKNILDANTSHYAFISSPTLFGFIDKDGHVMFSYEANKIIETSGTDSISHLNNAKAFIQKLYNDLDKQ